MVAKSCRSCCDELVLCVDTSPVLGFVFDSASSLSEHEYSMLMDVGEQWMIVGGGGGHFAWA